MADMEYHEFPQFGEQAGAAAPLVNWAGAVISIGLVAGLAIWGYRLAMRDVGDVPVVRALQGPMRVQPDDPGGRLALHQGLAVNRVQAAGYAEPAADRLILAPEPIALIESDGPVVSARPAPAAKRPAASARADRSDAHQPAKTDAAHDLAQLVSLNAPRTEAPARRDGTQTADAPKTIPASLSGVAASPRPPPRPESGPSSRTASASALPRPTPEMDADAIEAGTRLVQLGAFDTHNRARAEWERLNARFGAYFRGKLRVVQQAESGGRVFYRLRAAGFADLSDARRFCSALLAEKAACIPVVAR